MTEAVGAPTAGEVEEVAANLAELRERIAATGRDPLGVRIVGVTKGQPAAAVLAGLEAGVVDFGENYAAELLAKVDQLGGPSRKAGAPRWHFLGEVQRNKVARLASVVDVFHGVDRLEEATAIATRSPTAELLVEVDYVGTSGRGGVPPETAGELVAAIRSRGIEVAGLMTVAPAGDEGRAAAVFSRLAELGRDLDVRELSMGMTDDFEAAVRCGATIVRIGRALFGPRRARRSMSQ